MRGFSLKLNAAFRLDGAPVRIARILGDGKVFLDAEVTGELLQTSKQELLDAYVANRIVVADGVNHGQAVTNEQDVLLRYGRPFSQLSPKLQEDALRRKHYVDQFLEYGRPALTPKTLAPLIKEFAKSYRSANGDGDPAPPSPSTVYRWYRSYHRSKDTRSLVPRTDLRGPRHPRTDARVVDLFMESLVEAADKEPAWSIGDVETRLEKKLELENFSRPLCDYLRCPSKSTLYRLFDRVDEYDVAILKEGKASADRRFKITKTGVPVTHILERVEIDHTPVDVFLVDDGTGLPCGRPTVTMLLDKFSRMPLGYSIGYDDASTLAVMRALKNAILPKKPCAAVMPGLTVQHQWRPYGRIDCLVCDNGAEFHSDSLKAACFDLAIRILYCPPRQPRFKGAIERFLKTFNYGFAHKLPGTSFAKFYQRGDYDPLKHAVLTVGEFTHVLEKWILDIYAQSPHRMIGTTPWQKWCQDELSVELQLPPQAEDIAVNLGLETERRLGKSGIHLHCLYYSSDDLQPIVDTYGPGILVRVTYDPDDIGAIWVWAPDSADRILVRANLYEYANGLRLSQHKLIRGALLEQQKNDRVLENLMQARIELMESIDKLLSSRSVRTRRKAAKALGVNGVRPTGNLHQLVSVQPSRPKVQRETVIPKAPKRFESRPRSSL
ncbi:Mu transposase C-terminal domain-containing protein [Burkholderia cenocepacia]|uniref:Mu transposase C-terminal domain-containing protein n=1 Tax=Burkholderia cenocepacia TaxID=95486 RepID=UPI002ABD333C|nr:Mu transposase C-terminal domain-containing protein [Burkholderia cenocepacia]